MASSGGEAFPIPPKKTQMNDREKVLDTIVRSLSRSCENENWGLIVEAAEDYQRTCYKLKHAALPENKWFSEDEKDIFVKISTALYQKSTSLQSFSCIDNLNSITHNTIDAQKIFTVLESFEKGALTVSAMESTLKDVLPSSASSVGTEKKEDQEEEEMKLQTFLHMPEDEYEEALEEATEKRAGTLLTRKGTLPGYSYLNITIDKIDIKDPYNYIDPFITVSVKSLLAEDIEESQDTPVMREKESFAIQFNVTVQIQRPLEEIPGGSAIFFEFKHYKPKKGITSTKCFSFMEMDEIKPGKSYLEIYKKPTDYKRKKLSLFSAKLHYLHLNLVVEKPFSV